MIQIKVMRCSREGQFTRWASFFWGIEVSSGCDGLFIDLRAFVINQLELHDFSLLYLDSKTLRHEKLCYCSRVLLSKCIISETSRGAFSRTLKQSRSTLDSKLLFQASPHTNVFYFKTHVQNIVSSYKRVLYFFCIKAYEKLSIHLYYS